MGAGEAVDPGRLNREHDEPVETGGLVVNVLPAHRTTKALAGVRSGPSAVGLASCYANPLRYLQPYLLEAAVQPATPVTRVPRLRVTQRRITGDEVQAVLAGYRAGKSVYELATEHSCHRTTIRGILKRSGVTMRRIPAREDQIREMVRLYESGLSLVKVGEQVGFSDGTVHRYLREQGVPMRDGHGGPTRRA